jgi:hypothetical protein
MLKKASYSEITWRRRWLSGFKKIKMGRFMEVYKMDTK